MPHSCALVPNQTPAADHSSSSMALAGLDLDVFRGAAVARDLAALPKMHVIEYQYKRQGDRAGDHLPPDRCPEHAATLAVLASASSNCFRLLGLPEQLVLPTQDEELSKVCMLVHVLTRVIDRLMGPLLREGSRLFQRHYQEARSVVEQAVLDADLLPLLAAACTQLAPTLQPAAPGKPPASLDLTCEVLNLWNMVASALAQPAVRTLPTVLSHDQLSRTLGPVTQLTLAVLQAFDGGSPGKAGRAGRRSRYSSSSSSGSSDIVTALQRAGSPWAMALQCAASIPDLISDACRREYGRQQPGWLNPGSGDEADAGGSLGAASAAMSALQPALVIFHLGLLSQLLHKQWGSEQAQQQAAQLHRDLFAGLGMPGLAAAAPQPLVLYAGLDRMHLLSALQAAYHTAFIRSPASSSSGQGTPICPRGLHATVVGLVCGLLDLCAANGPFKGEVEVRVLTTGLQMLNLLLNDAALLAGMQRSDNGSSSAGSSSTSSSAAASALPVQALAAAVLGPLLAGVGPACVKAEDDHPPRVWPPLSLEELGAADAAMELLPLFGGLLRDILLAMRPADAAAALANTCQLDPTAMGQTLEWVLRNCFRTYLGNMSIRSCGPFQAGTCDTELNPETPHPCVARAAAAAAGATAAASPSECYSCGVGSLVLLCHRVVLGVTAAPWDTADSTAAGSGSPLAAGKQQVGLLNSCLKLLHRLAVQQPVTDEQDDSPLGSEEGLTPAAAWWACEAAAAVAAFGADLAGIAASSKLRTSGLSLSARGLLFVSRHTQAGSSSSEAQPDAQRVLLSSLASSCRVLQGVLSHLPAEGRGSLPHLLQQAQSLLARLQQSTELPTAVLVEAAPDLQLFSAGAAAQLPGRFGCNSPDCTNLSGDSELTTCIKRCGRCKVAYFCSKECQTTYYKQHKEACRALA